MRDSDDIQNAENLGLTNGMGRKFEKEVIVIDTKHKRIELEEK